MTIKKIALTGLLLSSIFLVACQPKEDEPETQDMFIEETVDENNIIMEGTNQAIPGEEGMMLDNDMIDETSSPTATPIM